MKNISPKTNWIIDAVLFSGFLSTFFLNLTGVEAHQWIGVFGSALAGYHLMAHWNWVKGTARRLASNISSAPWLNALVDLLVLTGLLGILISGLVISTWLNLALANYLDWRNLHVFASVATLGALVLKLGLHWRWIVAVARRFGKPKVQQPSNASLPPAQPLAAPIQPDRRAYTRREFVKLMGGVGLVAALAAANVLDDLQLNQQGTTTGSSPSASANTSSTSSRGKRRGQSASSTSSSGSACTVFCNRNCSFPGHCRRYVDTNNNNRCDLSECATS